jgi:cell division protein FtsL
VKGDLKEAEVYLNEIQAKINERTRKREALQEEVNELQSTKGITLAAKSFTDGSFSTSKS